jgi:hypothetical protein
VSNIITVEFILAGGCSGKVSSSCSTCGTRRVNLVTNPVINHWVCGKDREVFTTSGIYTWSFVTQIFHSGQRSQVGMIKPITAFPYSEAPISVKIYVNELKLLISFDVQNAILSYR